MIDIVSSDENGLATLNTQTTKAANILSVQLGSLEYAPDFGVDLKYFLTEPINFQNESFKAYLVERLANQGINVVSIIDLIESLSTKYTFTVSPEQNDTTLVTG